MLPTSYITYYAVLLRAIHYCAASDVTLYQLTCKLLKNLLFWCLTGKWWSSRLELLIETTCETIGCTVLVSHSNPYCIRRTTLRSYLLYNKHRKVAKTNHPIMSITYTVVPMIASNRPAASTTHPCIQCHHTDRTISLPSSPIILGSSPPTIVSYFRINRAGKINTKVVPTNEPIRLQNRIE